MSTHGSEPAQDNRAQIHPVILCGGDGTRLWPASRKALPKQFMTYGESTLFERTVSRAINVPDAANPVILCNADHRFLAATQLQHALADTPDITPSILLEPCGRNTAPAIAVAAMHLLQDDPLMLIMPSDHKIDEPQVFYEALQASTQAALDGALVTFGITPTSPETGYGYIQQGKAYKENAWVYEVARFVEKPDSATAEAFVQSGTYYWNSGIFFFKPSAYLTELEKFSPDIFLRCREAYEKNSKDLDFIRLDEHAFAACPSDSIDYAVMEHTTKACVAPMQINWSDLGSWQSFHAVEEHDGDGNTVYGDVLLENCSGSFVMSQSRLVTALGLKDAVIVETPDAVLVADKVQSQHIKTIVAKLKASGRTEAELHARVYRPWGSYESLITGDRFQVKRLMVNPGGCLSLQRHYHRAEHWVVVRGTAKVTINETESLLCEDESTYIPLGGIHRLENPGKVPLEIIEIQTGSYLGEDDIIRIEDHYGR